LFRFYRKVWKKEPTFPSFCTSEARVNLNIITFVGLPKL
jgi:hypothetical protein